ncbi:ABC transporter permease [Kineococcus gynurae]|uniref:ABC transporter permease n=1 Tax=Kineococcus gynurae TaxID=452979 RepID=A0ABV5LPG5_9ACTN
MSTQVEVAGNPPAPTRTPARRPRSHRWRSSGEVVALVVLVIVFTVLNPGTFATTTNLLTILDQAALPLIVGVGATLVILMGSIDLSVEGVMGAAGMTFVLLSANSRTGTDLGPVAVLAALAVGLALGLLLGFVHTRMRVPSFIASLGVWYVGLGVATLLFGTSGIPFLTDTDTARWSSRTTLGLPHSFWLALLVLVAGVVVGRWTRMGRSAYAIGADQQIARDNGIRVNRAKVAVFATAGLCSALAGVLAALQLGAGAATLGAGTLFLTIAAVVIGGTSLGGGRGGVLRTALGVVMLTVLNNGLILSGVSPDIQSGVSGAVLVAAIVVAAWPHRGRLRVVK